MFGCTVSEWISQTMNGSTLVHAACWYLPVLAQLAEMRAKDPVGFYNSEHRGLAETDPQFRFSAAEELSAIAIFGSTLCNRMMVQQPCITTVLCFVGLAACHSFLVHPASSNVQQQRQQGVWYSTCGSQQWQCEC